MSLLDWDTQAHFSLSLTHAQQIGYFDCDPASPVFLNFKTRYRGNSVCWTIDSANELRLWDIDCGVCRHFFKFGYRVCHASLHEANGGTPVVVCVCDCLETIDFIFIDVIYGVVLFSKKFVKSASEVRERGVNCCFCCCLETVGDVFWSCCGCRFHQLSMLTDGGLLWHNKQ